MSNHANTIKTLRNNTPKPRPQELQKFYNLLMTNAPTDYQPYLFRLKAGSKDPITGISWKSPNAQLTINEALSWMQNGGNIGLAALPSDPLINTDFDGDSIKLNEAPLSLTVKTRNRQGYHHFSFNFETPKIPNIATENSGEVRTKYQYVVAAGSYVNGNYTDLPPEEQADAGYYTICHAVPPTTITFQDLPQLFKDKARYDFMTKINLRQQRLRQASAYTPKHSNNQQSAIFSISAADVLLKSGAYTDNRRQPSIFHSSDTQANMSLHPNRDLITCWRHMHSLNGLQALAVLSGHLSCSQKARFAGDNGALFHAWRYAKNNGYIPADDPIPTRAMHYIAEKHCGYTPSADQILPRDIYNQILKIVMEEY